MADEIIDLGPFRERRALRDDPGGTMALWGAEGERSRFALPLWRIVQLAGAQRALIFWWSDSNERAPFVVLDTGGEPASLEIPESDAGWTGLDSGTLVATSSDVVVCLGRSQGRTWILLADGGTGTDDLAGRRREDILFLAGECAGLLFLRDLADDSSE